MKNKSTIIIFLVFVLVGFLIGTGIKSCNSESQDNKGEDSVTMDAQAMDSVVCDTVVTTEPEKEEAVATVSTDANNPVLAISYLQEKDGYYAFVAVCKNVPAGIAVHYELWRGSKMLGKSADGKFYGVPGVSDGKYKLVVVNEGTNSILVSKEFSNFKLAQTSDQQSQTEKEEKQLISVAEFQTALLSPTKCHILEGGKGSFVSRNLRISITNMRPDEVNKPTDIAGIREKIDFEIWRSARVESIEYDQKGYAIGVVISAVY